MVYLKKITYLKQLNKVKNLKASIFVTNYNNAKFITKCLNSVINQDYKNIEILFIDDLSLDNQKKILKKFKNKIKIIKNRFADGRNGIAAASNSGENNSNGSLSVGEEIEALLNNDLHILKSLKSDKDSDKDNKGKSNPKNLEEKKEEEKKAKKVNGGGKNKSSGGTEFKVRYQNNLPENPRAKFMADENTVYINLDHPYISDLKKGEASKDITKNLFFTKISHEIAYTEYAMGLVNLLHSKQYYGEDTADYLREVRDIINTLSTPSREG